MLGLYLVPTRLRTTIKNDYRLINYHMLLVSITPSKKRTDGRTDAANYSRSLSIRPFVRSFASSSVVSVTGVHPTGKRTAIFHRNLSRPKGIKSPINQ